MSIIVKSINGYEGLYLIDSIGNVISMPKYMGENFVNKYNILNHKVNRHGYKEVALTKDGKTTTYLLHRLIAIHFVDNPNGYDCVNHKNGIKSDNRIENLEWCTHQQNTKHAYDNNISGFKDSCNKGIQRMNEYNQYVSVVLISPEGDEISFSSSSAAAEYLGTTKDEITRAIRKCQRVKKHRAYGKKLECANGET